MDCDCPRLLNTVCFHDGGVTPEVVYHGTLLRQIRAFLIDLDSPSLV